jgi:outer membrane protein assembly factor BamB
MKKKLMVIFSVFSLIAVIFVGSAYADDEIEFILPEWGGGMVHSDPHLSDYIRLPVPKNNVDILWHCSELPGEKAGAKGNAIAGNGEIAACTFAGIKDNLVIYDYDGNRLWSSGDLLNIYSVFSAPMVDIHGRVIACDNKVVVLVDTFDYDNDSNIVEWVTEIPYGGIPFSPVITEDGTIVIVTDRGPIYAFNSSDGSLLGWKYLGENEKIHPLYHLLNIDDPGFFSTINTPCVKGNRIYVSTQYKGPRGFPTLRHHARLYAVDIDSNNPIVDERFKEVWYFDFGGPSQASPTLINNTIYFDGYRPKPSLRKKITLFAVTDMGDNGREEWRVAYPFQTYASFAYDPRGGFWYVDTFSGNLVYFSTVNGSILEKIYINGLVQEKGYHIPSSVMTICGNDTNPVLIVSATALNPLKVSSYVIGIDLAANNSLLWKVKLFEGFLPFLDLAFGQYTILVKNDEPRVVFGSFNDGVWAIGTAGSSN